VTRPSDTAAGNGGAPAVFDLVLAGGRVIDPETGTDGQYDVGITGTRIAAVSAEPLAGRAVIDSRGLVVAPGFIDLHSHGQAIPELRLQAMDGVTTALDLEAGRYPVAAAYAAAEREGRPVNYGFATSWAGCRMSQLAGWETGSEITPLLQRLGDPEWQAPASQYAVQAILDALGQDVSAGGIGVGVLLGYAQETDPEEYLRLAELAAGLRVPTFTHARDLAETRPATLIDGATEIVQAAAATGAHMHYCHVNSTSTRHLGRVLELVADARAGGAAVTTEAYPYGAGMTAIGAAFLHPGRLKERGLTPGSIRYLRTGEHIRDDARLLELRRADPGGLALVQYLRDDVPAEFGMVLQALTFPDSAVASDAMPLEWPGPEHGPDQWPIPEGAITHPRTAGTFARFLRLAREGELFSLVEAIRRCTLVPAEILADAVPGMRQKGRLQPGCDADIVIFNPDMVSDRATYDRTTQPSAGVRHVLVNGQPVVSGGQLVLDALPGQAVRGGHTVTGKA
jgi:cytosine/adenosine deaminase-related metal-dependent hydrolase